MSEQLKGEMPVDYTPPFIPLFHHLMDDLKERCGSKFFEIKKHRMHSNWSKRDTVAVWVDQQIVDLVNKCDRKAIKKSVDKIENKRKISNDSQNKGILKRLLSKSSNKEYSDSDCGSNLSDNTSRISSLDSDFRIRPKTSSANSPMPSCKNIWSVQDINKLREYEEKQILEEIARGLVQYQRNANFYYLDTSNDTARTFLLFQKYESKLDHFIELSRLIRCHFIDSSGNLHEQFIIVGSVQ